MKGLILKDYYVAIRCCKAYFIIIALFAAASYATEDGGSFFILYPCLLAGLLPVTLLSYDERSKWNLYSQTMPYKKSEIVSSKYIISLCLEICVVILMCIVQGLRMRADGTFTAVRMIELIKLLFSMFFIGSFTTPIMFKLGVEKGRIVYYAITLAIFFSLNGIINAIGYMNFGDTTILNKYSTLIFIAAFVIYLITWKASILTFENKEEV